MDYIVVRFHELTKAKLILLKIIFIQQDNQNTCIDYPPGLLGGGVGLLLVRSVVLRNEATENRNGFLLNISSKKQSKIFSDISERFKQHIKCGLGIDTPSNTLYTAMMKDGVENFTFEVLEECDRATLNDREKYYISFYRAQEHGYNMSRGGARE